MASTVLSLKKWRPLRFVVSVLVVISSFFSFIPLNNAQILSTCKFDAIYQLGDSISDTGNDIQRYPSCAYARLPYGQTFHNKATGRCSDGLLVINYLALSAEIPFLDAYLNKDGLFDHGVNFAVAGATAMSEEVLSKKNVPFVPAIISLSEQLDWMFSYFNTTCHFEGGNDYNYAFLGGHTLEQVKPMVPEVVQTIKYAVKRVIGYGATRVIVPGNFPIGCFPIYLTKFQTNDTSAHDELHCLKEFNNFSIYHNHRLQQAISELKEELPNVIIVYANYYNAFLWLFSKANMLGMPGFFAFVEFGIVPSIVLVTLFECLKYHQVLIQLHYKRLVVGFRGNSMLKP
ncbi:hypothetical protein PTKIN_Ptkin06aG0127300 [Pterospermum kingtungense]